MDVKGISFLDMQPISNTTMGASDLGGQFASMLAQQIKATDQLQKDSADLTQKAALGNAGVSLEDAQIASAKADLHLRLMLQVRNQAVADYKEIMNMPV